MAKDVASPALVRAGKEADKELPGCKFSGVLGDKSHTYGYHRGRNVLPSTDYSVKLSLDKLGNSKYASALDLSFTAAQMKVVTKRLRDSALSPTDPRMEPVREFYGTLNGRTVFGLTHTSERGYWGNSTSDNSHLWHIHISFFRKYANDYAKVRGVIDVMKGVPWKASAKPAPKPAPKPVTKDPVAVGGPNPLEEIKLSIEDVTEAFHKILPYGETGPGKRLSDKDFYPVSLKNELDYIWENVLVIREAVEKLVAAEEARKTAEPVELKLTEGQLASFAAQVAAATEGTYILKRNRPTGA